MTLRFSQQIKNVHSETYLETCDFLSVKQKICYLQMEKLHEIDATRETNVTMG